ncbi:serine hydrolase [Brevundimonas lenta]|uniref:CubicO group peptidase (Beta-lactamase class C family) n=1 Tax=Brevundimonas lenta TaxID=424796 RepID=A0A7W6NNL7_9CAUL|nr:serine hydrolase [Brevundimonas lenta]MBB4081604.1 CubicO group peptidase (beta-lactamase class C family) [Brevundimonas lenta]
MSKTILSSGARIAFVAAALVLCAAPALAQDVDRMDQIVRAAADRDEFSGSVLVARDGEILLDRGYGMANREWGVPNAGDTRFRLASVSKQFTAVAVVLLAERGLVDLDAPVKTYLPDAPAAWDAVTVRHLLNHTSGVPNFTAFDDYAASKTLPTTPAELIGRFRDRPLDFQPGERWLYSNSGYVLLTAIIEKVSGQSYADFVTANLFQPLGMSDSGYDRHDLVLPRRASGYSPSSAGVVNADYIDMSVPQGAGGLYSTTRDLLKWEQGLFGGRLLNADSMRALTTPGRNDYALGLRVTETDGDTVISHNGGIEGFNTYLGYETGDRLTVVVLGNLNGLAPDTLGTDLMTLARGGTVTLHGERQAIAVAPEALHAYEGVYEATPTFAFTMSVVDGKLMTQATGQDQFELFAEGPDAFFLTVVDARVVFTRDASGAVDGMVLHQNGRQLQVKKK